MVAHAEAQPDKERKVGFSTAVFSDREPPRRRKRLRYDAAVNVALWRRYGRVPPTEHRDERPRTRCTRTSPAANCGQFPRARRSGCTTFSPELSSQRTCGYRAAETPRRRETVELLSRTLPAGRVGPAESDLPPPAASRRCAGPILENDFGSELHIE